MPVTIIFTCSQGVFDYLEDIIQALGNLDQCLPHNVGSPKDHQGIRIHILCDDKPTSHALQSYFTTCGSCTNFLHVVTFNLLSATLSAFADNID